MTTALMLVLLYGSVSFDLLIIAFLYDNLWLPNQSMIWTLGLANGTWIGMVLHWAAVWEKW